MLNDRVALVTGAARGIGKAIAMELAKAGADIAMIATSESEAAISVKTEIQNMGKRVLFLACDVSDPAQVNSAVADILAEFGKIDILVNNAGITKDKLLMQMSEEDIDAVLSVNLKGCFHTVKACLRTFMKNKYGRIINITSVSGMIGNPGQANYAASKAGVIGFTKTVAKEYASKGITCNAVAPGFICTDMTDRLSDEAKAAMAAAIPVKRFGTPEDVANVVRFLAEEASSFITGEVIKVDGGMCM